MSESISLYGFFERFPDEQSCIDYIVEKRWGGKPVCVRCGSVSVYACKTRHLFKCKDCTKQFSVRYGTIFEDSRLPLQKWLLAVYMATSMKRGVSSIQLAKQIQTTQKTSWFMLHRIREAMVDGTFQMLKTAAIDEAYFGGTSRGIRGRGARGKKPVFGLIEPGGKVYCQPVENTKRATLYPIIQSRVVKGATIMSDEFVVYKTLPELGYIHKPIKHKAYQWADDEGTTTNPIEQFWSHAKRTVYGTYLQTSHKHLGRYMDEVMYRFNNRDLSDEERFGLLLERSVGKRMRYKELVAKQ